MEMELIWKIALFVMCVASVCSGASIVVRMESEASNLTQIPEPRIIGGDMAAEAMLPYIVSIQNTFGEHYCGGSIISKRWILTAAHCLNYEKKYIKVVTGTTDWTTPGAEYFVEAKFIHCSYNKPWMHNDIGLLRLNRDIVFNKHTKPIQLAQNIVLKESDKLRMAGWGSTKKWGHDSQNLRTVTVNYVDTDNCRAHVKNDAWLDENSICTDTTLGKGSCNDDSGGPVVYSEKYLVGVINWGEPCAVGKPDVSASVMHHYDWIKNIMAGAAAC